MDFWTKEEYLQFLEGVRDKPVSYMAFQLLYWTGARIGELMALTYNDINWEQKTISISKSYQRIKGRDVITTPKTPKSNRIITLPDFLVEDLREYTSKLYGIMPDARMFQITKSYLTAEMLRGVKKTGVKKIRLHDLRHPYVKHKLKNLSDYWPDRLSAKDNPTRPVFLLSFRCFSALCQSAQKSFIFHSIFIWLSGNTLIRSISVFTSVSVNPSAPVISLAIDFSCDFVSLSICF